MRAPVTFRGGLPQAASGSDPRSWPTDACAPRIRCRTSTERSGLGCVARPFRAESRDRLDGSTLPRTDRRAATSAGGCGHAEESGAGAEGDSGAVTIAWTLPCPMSYASRSAEESIRPTHLRISCAPMPSTKSSASARQLDALVRRHRRAPDDSLTVALSISLIPSRASRQRTEPNCRRRQAAPGRVCGGRTPARRGFAAARAPSDRCSDA